MVKVSHTKSELLFLLRCHIAAADLPVCCCGMIIYISILIRFYEYVFQFVQIITWENPFMYEWAFVLVF